MLHSDSPKVMNDYSVLLAASCPPPIAGQSIATKMLLRTLERARVEHRVVNISRGLHTQPRWLSYARRAGQVSLLPVRWVIEASALRASPRIFYLQLGQSAEAMLRDLPLIGLAAQIGGAIVLHIHGGGFRRAFDSAFAPLRLAVRKALRRADRVIVLSDGLRPMLDGLVNLKQIAVIANGVEQEVLDYASKVQLSPLGTEGLVVLYLSNLIETKGYQDILETARLSQEQALPHQFILAGRESETTFVRPDAFIERHGLQNVRYVGPVSGPEKARLIASADVFALPTTYPIEGQPIAILEAMHFGLPVLTTATGGIPDVVRDAENGFLLPPHSPPDILNAINRLQSDPGLLHRIGECNQREARQHYTEAAHAKAMLDLFAEVAAERPNRTLQNAHVSS